MIVAWRVIAVAVVLMLAGCASKPPQQPQPPTERASLDRSARLAFDQGRYAQAVTLYQSALQQALLEDDPGAIIDARFNLALSYTYLGDYDEALSQLTQANAERQRRALAVDPGLMLLEATVVYRSGRADRALGILDRVFQTAPGDGALAQRGHFLAGLIAADRGDALALQQHITVLQGGSGSDTRADLLELLGAQAAQAGDAQAAYARFDQAVVLRGIQRDYRGMVRILASAGAVADNAGDTARAANYYLRAGRSAAQRNEPGARRWLQRASTLGAAAGDRALVIEADELLGELDAVD